MDNSNSPKSSSRFFSIIVLALFIVILPAGSWYYLQRGADFRKSLYDDLIVKNESGFDQFKNSNAIDNGLLASNRLEGFTTLLATRTSADNARFQDLVSQFDKAYTFRVLTVLTEGEANVLSGESIRVSQEVYKDLFSDKDYLLVDVEGRLRNTYDSTEEDYTLMIEHIAILLPRTPEKDIKIKK